MVVSEQDIALTSLGARLQAVGYSFTAVTPETHRRVLARERARASVCHRDVFGWNRAFEPEQMDLENFRLLQAAGAVRRTGKSCVSTVRFATYRRLAFLHSGYPTIEPDSVFFGPDTYRFLRLIEDVASAIPPPARVADIGTGSGAAAIVLARLFPRAEIIATDINAQSLRFTAINATLNDVRNLTPLESDVAQELAPGFDLIVANPPYLVDPAQRRYRHGGGLTGSALSLRILTEGSAKLSPGGHLILYTGVAIVDGRDEFRAAADLALEGTPWRIQHYREIDADVFGEELDTPAYAGTERIAVVGAIVGPRAEITSGDQGR